MSKVVSANLLASGTVVFLGVDDTWVPRIEDAVLFSDAASAEAGLGIARRDEVRALIVDGFIVDKKAGVDGADTLTLRNAIRAHGPTIDYLPASRRSVA